MDDNDWDKDLPLTIICTVGLIILLVLVAMGML